jgi:hypothetical protein
MLSRYPPSLRDQWEHIKTRGDRGGSKSQVKEGEETIDWIP